MAIRNKSHGVRTTLDDAFTWGLGFCQQLYQEISPGTESAEYQAWRQQFMRDRIRLAWCIIFPCFLTIVAVTFYILFINAGEFDADMESLYGSASLGDLARQLAITSSIVVGVCLCICLLMQQMRWFQRRPMLLFLALSWSITLADQIVGTVLGVPVPPNWTLAFLGQALLIPVYWQLHLLAQLVPAAYYTIVNPLLGFTTIGDRSVYDVYSIGALINLVWVCVICNLAVYLYERLKRSEFEAQRELKIFLHSVSHDLRNPVMGTSIVLKSLLKKTDQKLTLDRSILERLQQGSDRQLMLINSLLEAHDTEVQGVQLTCEPLMLRSVVASVLSDLLPILEHHQINLVDRIPSNLPLVRGDAHQLWRLYCNLITNAIKHNPNGITVTLTAERVAPDERWRTPRQPNRQDSAKTQWVRCTVEDTGVGIEPQQRQEMFNLYARGSRARHMPGLGLGLYLCKQIILAHGGQIGIISDRGKGTTFWFTLPVQP